MPKFPIVLVLSSGEITNAPVQEHKRYSLWIGKKEEKVSHFVLSSCNDMYTMGKLVLAVDAEFTKTTALVDVFKPYQFQNYGPIAKFFSPKYTYAYEEKQLDEFINDNTEEEWSRVLGVPVSFYPFGGPADMPEKYPDFGKSIIESATESKEPEQPPERPVRELTAKEIDDGWVLF